MPTDAGTDTWTAAVSGSDALRDAATVTATVAHSAAEKFGVSATDVWTCDPYPTVEGGIQSGTATNTGAHTAYPTVAITGPGSKPSIKNTTTGEEMRWDEITLADTDTLTADCRIRRATLNGKAAPSPSAWLTLAPGANAITVRAAGAASGFSVELEWSDLWQS